jgi:hypothetical protein
MRVMSLVILAAVAGFSGCTGAGTGPEDPPLSYEYWFEDGLDDWVVRAMDTELGDGHIEWSIEPSIQLARRGQWSVKYFMNNLNDAGKIWIERPFEVEPQGRYSVRVRYEFATADFHDINLFRVITGVLPDSPGDTEALVSTYQDQTGNGYDTDVGFRWLNKDYTFTATAGVDGQLHVLIGVWGTWETHRTYYVDDVHITLSRIG